MRNFPNHEYHYFTEFTLVLFHFGEISLCDSSIGSVLATVFNNVIYLTEIVYSKKD